MRRTLDRVRELGWFVKVFGFDDDFLAVEAELRKIKLPAIIDHLGGPDYRRGTSAPVIRLMLDLLKNDNWWIGLSNGDLRSQSRLSVGRRGGVRPPVLRGGAGPLPVGHGLAARPSFHPARQGRRADHGIGHEFEIVALLERYVPTGTRATGCWSTIRPGFSGLTG